MATIKQKKAFVKFIENHGNMRQAMLAAGYSEVSADNPTLNLASSKGWKELLEEYLPDDTLLKVHKEGLQATKIHTSHTEPDKEVPDFAVRHKYLETGLKVKGKIKEDDKGNTTNIMILRLDV